MVFAVPYGVVEYGMPQYHVHVKQMPLSVTDNMHKLDIWSL